MGITVCTVSGKGGVGKSTVSSGLAIAADKLEKKVLLIDLDAGLRCLDMMFGIDDKIVFDLSDAIECSDISKAVYKARGYRNIDIVPAPLNPGKIDFSKLRDLIFKAKRKYDFVLLDFPAGADFDDYGYFADARFLIVSSADNVSIRDASVISGNLKTDIPPRLIINRFDIDMIKSGVYKNIDTLIDNSFTRLIGIVPADGELLLLSNNHTLKNKGRAEKAFIRILRRISGENVPLPKIKKI